MRWLVDLRAARVVKIIPEGPHTRLVLLGFTALLFIGHRATNPWRPRERASGNGWASWNDQGAYLRAARGWAAHLPPTPTSQTYEPGYPVLGSLFVHLTPFDPFLIPDLMSVLGACWWFGLIAREVLGNRLWSREVGLAVFAATSLLDPRAALLWTTPWTTTPTVALTYGALASGLSTLTRPRARAAFAAAFTSGLVAAIRPGDLPLVLLTAGIAVLLGVLQARGALRPRMLVGFGLGAMFGLGTALLLHLSVWGPRPSPYMTASAAEGFEWRLLLLRWVLLMDGPAPETAGTGIAYAFPYLLLGLPALLMFALAGTRDAHARAPHVVLGCYALLSLTEFLSYRDLHPTGLWRFFNIHYFKWILPIGGLYAVLLCRETLAGRRGAAAATVALAILMFCWFPILKRLPLQNAVLTSAHQVMLPNGLPDIEDAVLLPLTHVASADDIIHAKIEAASPAHAWTDIVDFRAYPHGGDALLVPLRPIAAPLALAIATNTSFDTERAPMLVRQAAVFHLPWGFGPQAASAELAIALPPADGRIDLAAYDSARYLDQHWGPARREGRRLKGAAAELHVRIHRTHGLVLGIDAYVTGGITVQIGIKVNGRRLAPEVTLTAPQAFASVTIPMIGQAETLSLTLLTDAAARRALVLRAISIASAPG